jgi:SMI1 / KNR4 family (SUKH-1)
MSLEAGLRHSTKVNDELETLLAKVSRRDPASAEGLDRLAAESGVALPDDYVAFMASSNGGDGDVGRAWIEFWPVERVGAELQSNPHYEGVVLFAGDGANTVYGFDRFRDGEIVEGDWIGLNRDELIAHGGSLTEFLRSISG